MSIEAVLKTCEKALTANDVETIHAPLKHLAQEVADGRSYPIIAHPRPSTSMKCVRLTGSWKSDRALGKLVVKL